MGNANSEGKTPRKGHAIVQAGQHLFRRPVGGVVGRGGGGGGPVRRSGGKGEKAGN